MAVYGQMVLTTQGQALYAKAQAGTTLTFTRMQIGGGQLGSGQDPTTLTALITPIAYFNINSESTNGNTALIKGIFENTNINTSTYSCELGLFAQDPTAGEILYAYANAGSQGDTIPPISDGPLSKQYQINVAIGNATSVTANIPSNTYVATTQMGVANGVATLDSNGKVPASQLSISAPANATTTSAGIVEIADTPSGAVPVAITTDNGAYKAINVGTFVKAGAGISVTAGTNSETVAVSPATASTIGGVKVGTGVSVQSDGTIALTAATTSTIGGVKIGNGVSVQLDGTITMNVFNHLSYWIQ